MSYKFIKDSIIIINLLQRLDKEYLILSLNKTSYKKKVS